jgi:hypothetical protein
MPQHCISVMRAEQLSLRLNAQTNLLVAGLYILIQFIEGVRAVRQKQK